MKRIIIPTDFSEISKNSIVYGFQLAAKMNLSVDLIHVLELYKFAAGTSEAELISTILPADNIQEMEAAAGEAFKKLIEEIKPAIPSDVPYKYKVVPGHLVNEMVIESSSEDIEFMILAVAGNQDLITRFTHTTISSIITEAICPVLIIPSSCNFKTLEKVVLATDFNKSDLSMLDNFISIFAIFNPTVEVLHVAVKTNDFKTELKFAGFKQLISEKIAHKNITYSLQTNKHVVQGILEELKLSNADLLLMLKEHEGFFKSLFEVSKTEKLTHYLKIPMLSYREQKSK